MNVLDGIRQLNQDVARQTGKEFGADGVELSAHALCAEDHLPYQGLQFTNRQFDQIQALLPRPIGQWNCKHFAFPILHGISKPAYTQAQLDGFKRNSEERITIDGITKTRYEWTQEQRRIETAIRQRKDVANLARASGDDVLRRNTQAHINKLQNDYRRISEQAGLNQRFDKTRVAGFRAVKTADQLKNPLESGIIDAVEGRTYFRVLDASGQEKYRYLQTDAIQNLDSAEAVRKHFEYVDRWGEVRSPIDESFSKLKLETQRELAEGLEYSKSLFVSEGMPSSIAVGKPVKDAYGSYRPSERLITINRKMDKTLDEAFPTAVHETAHFYDHINGGVADSVLKEALKGLGLRSNSKEAKELALALVRGNHDDARDPVEVFAHAVERFATKKGNKLSDAIIEVLRKRGVAK